MRKVLKFIHDNTLAKKTLVLNIYSVDINFINKWIFLQPKFLGRRRSQAVWVSTGKSVYIALYSYYFINSQLWDKGVSLTLHMSGKCVSPNHNSQGAVRPDRRRNVCHSLDFRFWFFSFKNENLFLAADNHFWPWSPSNMDKGAVKVYREQSAIFFSEI